MKTIIKEVELAGDLKEAIAMTDMFRMSDNIKKKINKFDEDTLILVKKEIDRGVIIHSIEEVTDELIAKSL